jgi:hypothetical protein
MRSWGGAARPGRQPGPPDRPAGSMSGTPGADRRAGEEIVLPVFLLDHQCTVEGADGNEVGRGFRAFLDGSRTVELFENERVPVLPGVFYTRVAGVSFHDDVLQLPRFAVGESVEIRHEPASELDQHALAVYGGGTRVGYVPGPIADVLAPGGTRAGRGVVLMEWSRNGARQNIWVLGSMHVKFSLSTNS